MKPGDIIRDLEGVDIGDKGATIIEIDDDKLTIIVLDTKEQVTVPRPESDQVVSEEPFEGTGVVPHDYDPRAINSPEVTNIRRLPMWWGPRDPNNPSSLTDVMWRPSPYWRRMLQRHYDVEEGYPIRFRDFNYIPVHAAAAQERIASLWPRLARTKKLNSWDLEWLGMPAEYADEIEFMVGVEDSDTIMHLAAHYLQSEGVVGVHDDSNVYVGSYVNLGDKQFPTLIHTDRRGYFIGKPSRVFRDAQTRTAKRGRRSGYKSKKKLFAFLEAEGAPLRSHDDETYGRASKIYLDWPDYATRRKWDRILQHNGFKVNERYSPKSATSEVQVSYFKGTRWDE